MESFADRLASVREHMEKAAAKAGRNLSDIELVAVSKTHSPEAITEALEAGLTIFGESRVQEAKAKIPLISLRARWQFIGHLQKNKIRHALPLFELFHGVDSLELARDLDRIAAEMGTFPRILLEVNVAGESTKFGFRPELLSAQMEELLALERLQIDGLMTIAPYAPRTGGRPGSLCRVARTSGPVANRMRRSTSAAFHGNERRLRNRDRGGRHSREGGNGTLWYSLWKELEASI